MATTATTPDTAAHSADAAAHAVTGAGLERLRVVLLLPRMHQMGMRPHQILDFTLPRRKGEGNEEECNSGGGIH